MAIPGKLLYRVLKLCVRAKSLDARTLAQGPRLLARVAHLCPDGGRGGGMERDGEGERRRVQGGGDGVHAA